MSRILITCAQMQLELPEHLSVLSAAGYEVLAPPPPGQQFSAADLAPLMPGVVGMIAGDDELSKEFFDSSPDLQVLVRWGIGTDSVDKSAANMASVTVRNTPGVFGDEVADSALAYVLMCARGHHLIDAEVRAGGWPKVQGNTLSGETAGVIGLGAIGRGVVRRLAAFGVTVLGYDPYALLDSRELGCEATELPDLLGRSKYVVLTCPLTEETHHLIDADALAQMRSDAFLVNVARGPVVDELALASALADGEIAGAGLDVFEVEPLPQHSALRELSGVVLGAHNGSNTREGVRRASREAVRILLEELQHARA